MTNFEIKSCLCFLVDNHFHKRKPKIFSKSDCLISNDVVSQNVFYDILHHKNSKRQNLLTNKTLRKKISNIFRWFSLWSPKGSNLNHHHHPHHHNSSSNSQIIISIWITLWRTYEMTNQWSIFHWENSIYEMKKTQISRQSNASHIIKTFLHMLMDLDHIKN